MQSFFRGKGGRTYYADPYHPMSLIDLKSSAILGSAVAIMVSSYSQVIRYFCSERSWESNLTNAHKKTAAASDAMIRPNFTPSGYLTASAFSGSPEAIKTRRRVTWGNGASLRHLGETTRARSVLREGADYSGPGACLESSIYLLHQECGPWKATFPDLLISQNQ